ncbi:MAG: cyclomaltodextrinase C-terminal domain-containing protein, partial [Bacteroidales bacterium]|nr:cyclomaltodextrinase C-terminal domain-containing protein [Bacteroidales bacterium]
PLRDAMIAALCEDNVWWNEGMTRVYNVIAQDFAYKDMDNLMIFFANHDHPRTGDILKADPAKMKLAIGLLATLRGIPQLYYGDEMMFLERPGFGNDGSKRIDFPGGWEGDSVNLFTDDGRAEAGGSYKDLHDFTKTLLRWRKDKDVIHHGKTLHFLSRENHGRHNITENTYGFFRYDDKDTVFVFVNNTLEEKTLPWHRYGEICPSEVRAKDVISGEEITLSDSTAVPAKSILVAEL